MLRSTMNKLLVLTSLVFALVLSTSVNVDAQTDVVINLTEDEQTLLVQKFVEYGIDYETSVELVNKYIATGLIDSIDPTKEPVDSEIYFSDGSYVLKKSYADGSVCVSSVTRSEDGSSSTIIPTGVNLGDWNSGSTWWTCTECKAYQDRVLAYTSFYFDASGHQGSSAVIDSIYSPYVYIAGGTASEISLYYFDDHHARLQFQYNSAGGYLSETNWMDLHVNGYSNMYVDSSF